MLHAVTNDHEILIGNQDLATLMTDLDFIEMWMYLHTGQKCTAEEKALINALMVSLMDHGVTPTTVAARMTILSAPESIQGAVAAGILGAGDRFLGVTENVARALYEAGYSADRNADDAWVESAAHSLLQGPGHVHGVGHNIHRGSDPRVEAVIRIATDLGFSPTPWKVLDRAAQLLTDAKGRTFVVNNAGAVGAAVAALGLEPEFARGLSVVARSAGLVAHAIEEKKTLGYKTLWEKLVADENAIINKEADNNERDYK